MLGAVAVSVRCGRDRWIHPSLQRRARSMTQLSDDCFAFGGDLPSVDAALAEIEARLTSVVETETARLEAAHGRILSRDIIAAINLPPHANSAVDGYAFAHGDLMPDRDTSLPVSGRAAAGHPLGRPS